MLKKGSKWAKMNDIRKEDIKMNEIRIEKDYAVMVIKSRTYGEIKVLISLEDVEKVRAKKWSVARKGDYLYATADNGKTLLHRYIMGVTERNVWVDHASKITSDNRRENLRVCSPSQNGMNRKSVSNSGVKNVSRDSQRGKWKVNIKIDGKTHSKRFTDFNDAVSYRNQLIYDLHGQFADYGEPMYLYDADVEQAKELELNGFYAIKVEGAVFKFLLTDELKAYLGYIEE